MSNISELISRQKKEATEKQLLSTLKFGVVFLPLLLLCCTINQLSARQTAQRYDRECPQRNAPTVSVAQADTPCIYTQETAHLHEVEDSRGRTEDEEIHLTEASGDQTTVTLERSPTGDNWAVKDNRLSSSMVDGLCLVERWHGTVTTVYTAALRLTTHDNPDVKYGGSIFLAMAYVFVIFLTCCGLLWWKVSRRNSRSDYPLTP